jgi:hypothetical protein
MPNFDNQAALAAFKAVLDSAKQLKAAISADATISKEDDAKLRSLATNAATGQSLLVNGARKRRDERLVALATQIDSLNEVLFAGPDKATSDQVRAKIVSLTAERAQLLLANIGDFSDVVSPQQVDSLISLSIQVHEQATKKANIAAIIGKIEQAIGAATTVIAAVAKAV